MNIEIERSPETKIIKKNVTINKYIEPAIVERYTDLVKIINTNYAFVVKTTFLNFRLKRKGLYIKYQNHWNKI